MIRHQNEPREKRQTASSASLFPSGLLGRRPYLSAGTRAGARRLRLLSVTVSLSAHVPASRVHGCRLTTWAWPRIPHLPMTLDPVRGRSGCRSELFAKPPDFSDEPHDVIRCAGDELDNRVQPRVW
jgi:hypothetical protein